MADNTINEKQATELAEKLIHAESSEEIMAIAEAQGFEIDAAQAEALLRQSGELSDEELDNVAGGDITDCYPWSTVVPILEQLRAKGLIN